MIRYTTCVFQLCISFAFQRVMTEDIHDYGCRSCILLVFFVSPGLQIHELIHNCVSNYVSSCISIGHSDYLLFRYKSEIHDHVLNRISQGGLLITKFLDTQVVYASVFL